MQRDGRVRVAHERRTGVSIRVDGHGGDAHVVGTADDAPGNLAAVGDEQPRNGPNGHIRHVPNSFVPWTLLLWHADSDIAMTSRVSRGSIMPSSETREVA